MDAKHKPDSQHHDKSDHQRADIHGKLRQYQPPRVEVIGDIATLLAGSGQGDFDTDGHPTFL
jgi:hypothetical protein